MCDRGVRALREEQKSSPKMHFKPASSAVLFNQPRRQVALIATAIRFGVALSSLTAS